MGMVSVSVMNEAGANVRFHCFRANLAGVLHFPVSILYIGRRPNGIGHFNIPHL
jgi:hypothetical protein